MKKIIKIYVVIVMILSFTACDEESNFKNFDAVLTPVYSLTNISNGPFKINIYREKALIIEYISEVNVVSYKTSNYQDNSTETSYNITVTRVSEDETPSQSYEILADKITGEGTLTINTTDVHNIVLNEVDVYN